MCLYDLKMVAQLQAAINWAVANPESTRLIALERPGLRHIAESAVAQHGEYASHVVFEVDSQYITGTVLPEKKCLWQPKIPAGILPYGVPEPIIGSVIPVMKDGGEPEMTTIENAMVIERARGRSPLVSVKLSDRELPTEWSAFFKKYVEA